MRYISVNNAVLVCGDCAVQHRGLPSGVSYVMDISDAGETISTHKCELLKFGGNARFLAFLDLYKEQEDAESVFTHMPIQEKYATNACKYYRHKIQQLAKQETPQMEAPILSEALAVIEDDIEDWALITDDDRRMADELI